MNEEKKCEYCTNCKKINCIDAKIDKSNLQIVKRYHKDYPQENILHVEIQDDEDENIVYYNYFPINYCMVCGKKLEVQADE